MTTYGAPAYHELATVIAKLKAGDPLAFITIIVPTDLVAVTARRHLAAGHDGQPGIAAIEFLTLRRFADRIAGPTLTAQARRPAVANVVTAAVRAVLRESPGMLEAVADHAATTRAVVSAHRELRDLTPDALQSVTTANPLTADIVRIHREVVARLSGDWYDELDLLTTAAAQVAANPDDRSVVLFLPANFSPAELGLLAALRSTGTVEVVAAQTGSPRLDAWYAPLATALGLPNPEPITDPQPVATRIFHASDSDDEVRCIVRDVVQTLAATPAHRVAVLWSSREPYARILTEHLASSGITWHGPGATPLVERGPSRGMLGLLGLALDGLRRDALFDWLAGTWVIDGNGRRVPTQKWERLSRSAGVISEDDWEPRLDYLAAHCRKAAAEEQAAQEKEPDDGRAWLVKKHTREANDADELKTFVVTLRDRLVQLRSLTSWTDIAAWLDAARREILGLGDDLSKLGQSDALAALRLKSHIGGLPALDAVDPVAHLVDLRDGLEQQLVDDLPTHGHPGNGLYVGPIGAAVGLNADVVYVIGLSDDQFPGRSGEDALLPDEARALADGQLRGLRDRLDQRHRDLLVAFSAAPTVIASFPRGDLRRSSERLPSRWLVPSLRAVTGQPDLAATKWESALRGLRGPSNVISNSRSYAESVTTTAAPASEQEWRQRAAAGGDRLRNDLAVTAGRALLAGRNSRRLTRYDGIVGPGVPTPGPMERPVSPTSIEGWAKCPFAYFMQRLLGVSPIEMPEDLFRISAMDIGTLMHGALEKLLDAGHLPSPQEPWSDDQRALLAAVAQREGSQLEARGLTGHAVLWAQDEARILAMLDAALDDDNGYRAQEGATWETAELSFGRAGNPAVPVALDDGTVVYFAGYADRVDRLDDGSLVVVDLKTGSAKDFKDLKADNPTANGVKLQLPVYALAARQAYGDAETRVRAQYWFVGRDHGQRPGYELTDDVLDHYRHDLGVIVGGLTAGVFPMVPPAPSSWSGGWVKCHYCDPDGLGTNERHRQWLAKSEDPAVADYLAMRGQA